MQVTEFYSFSTFCKVLNVSPENNGGALGRKLQKMEPNLRVSCVHNLLGPEEHVRPLDLFPVDYSEDIEDHRYIVLTVSQHEDYFTALRFCTFIIQESRGFTKEANEALQYRAMVLYELGLFRESMIDANRVFKESTSVFDKDSMVIHKAKTVTQNALKNPHCEIPVNDTDPNYEENFKLPKIEDPHEWIPNASKKINPQFSSKYGRHFVAAENISPGDLLFIDKPYAFVLGNRSIVSHCSHCLMRCLLLISCRECKTLYCSESCRGEAYSQYHRIECQIAKNKKCKYFEVDTRLALRMLMIATKQGSDLKKIFEHPVYRHPFTYNIRPINKQHFQKEYYHIHHLESHDKEITSYDLIRYCYKAAVLIELLKWTTFFEKPQDITTERDKSTSDEWFVASLLLRYLFIVKFNGTMIRDRVERPVDVQTESIFYDVFQTGLALYPLSSLLNHSCNSNALIVSNKTSCACYATQPILKGEQIFIHYHCNYLNFSLDYRQNWLQENYYFKCDCRPCMEKWPGQFIKLEPLRTSKRLSNEDLMFYKNKMEELLEHKTAKERCRPEQMTFLCDLMMKFYQNTKHPNITYENAMALMTSILLSKGNCYGLDDYPEDCNYCYYEPKQWWRSRQT